MKKFIISIVTFAYLASTSGATICIQQCMGKTIGWSISEKASDQCTKCGMHNNASNDCCKGHIKVLKVHNDQNLPEVYVNKIYFSPAFFQAGSCDLKESNFLAKNYVTILDLSPPPDNDFCILYCTFRV